MRKKWHRRHKGALNQSNHLQNLLYICQLLSSSRIVFDGLTSLLISTFILNNHVSMEHLRTVSHAGGVRLILLTPGNFPFGASCIPVVNSSLSIRICHVLCYPDFVLNIPRYFYFYFVNLFKFLQQQIKCIIVNLFLSPYIFVY